MKLKKGLIIKGEHCQKILDGKKTYEMRSTRTKFRGEFGLIIAGTKKIFGKAELFGVMDNPINTEGEWHDRYHLHRCDEFMPKWPWGWMLTNIVKFDEPIPYNHKPGQVTWVNL